MKLTNKQILVVDDDEAVRETMQDILMEMHCDVKTASNGCSAIDIIKKNDFDVTFMDVRMPGMNGIETLVRIKQDHPSMNVVMMTAYASDEMITHINKIGVKGIVFKPFDWSNLEKFL